MNPLYYLLKHHLLFKARLIIDSIDQKSFLGFFKEWQGCDSMNDILNHSR